MACTRESHADIKNDPRRWATDVEYLGEIDAGYGEVVVLANCRACRSTLAIRKDVSAPLARLALRL